ncbi:MAG: FAD-dependent oxidoreductase [Gemmatimonadaceae bacterium]|nr:FAD-dependent oxidoreductase [Gemmatimonadaceae bacterium]
MLAPERVLPAHLAERVEITSPAADAAANGQYVLYWARTAVRAHENPALDVAVTLGQALQLPVFVYHALSERYPFASDRHHMFILEGARDFAAELATRGIGTAFHLEREGHRGPHLTTLAAQAAVVVTELMPVAPLDGWAEALRDAIDAPVWQVDTACVVPMTLTNKAYDRAFVYRDATAALRRARVQAPWRDVPYTGACYIPALPFTPIDLATADLAALIATCRIDHGVGPVADTRGGSVAGYARWNEFVRSGRLDRYDRMRNDPTRGDGVSRMSAYLHYGMVSPLRLAREAAARPGDGAAKWLDELLVWRELAYTFCHHRADHDTIDAIPAWARETLQQHERDHRELYAWEQLARGRTSSAFWNAMQQSLLAHGEIHNNVRMTWGKAFSAWTPDAREALAMSIDLNHRYALDGRDPASFGGLLWCLGQFDRPFTPPNRILGTVRGRAVSEQAARINVEKYTRHIQRPVYSSPTSVAVIGAGLSGLLCARTLADHNIAVTVFEKSRGLGGRAATRRDGPWQFDHGAQYFTVRDARLAPLVQSWQQQGVIDIWNGTLAVRESGAWQPAKTGVRRWVATPGMSALGTHLADDIDVRLNTTVAHIQREGRKWRLVADGGGDLGTYDIVLTCVPSPQAQQLLEPVAPHLATRAAEAVMHPTMATMLVLAERPDFAFDGAFINDDPVLGWIARDAGKPTRKGDETWVLHATRAWSEAHLDDDRDSIAADMTEAFQRVIGTTADPVHRVGHRWRYALPDPVAADAALYDAASGLGAGGDWCGGPRVEGALLSGLALAGRVLTYAHLASA